jgi:hypothetical protein
MRLGELFLLAARMLQLADAFIARTHEEIQQARQQWNAGGDRRFGEVSHFPGPGRSASEPRSCPT